MPIAWGAPPPFPHLNPRIRIWSVKPGVPSTVRLLGAVEGILVHYDGPDSGPCYGAECRGCNRRTLRWKGFAPAEIVARDPATGKNAIKRFILEVSEALSFELREIPLGAWIEVRRVGPRANDRVSCRLSTYTADAEPSEAFDVRPYLERLWHLASGYLSGQDCQAPSPAILPIKPSGGVPASLKRKVDG